MARKKKTVRRKTSGPRKRPARSRTASMTARRRPRRSSKVGAEKGGGNGGGPAGLSLAELQAELTTRVADLKRRRADLEAELAEINAELAEVDDSLAAAVPAAVLLAAAPAAPGWLWASEFDGYDSLSYHLELPAAWAEAGRAAPLTRNVYSFMPNAVEHAFLHVGLLAGEVRTAGTAAQLLHAAMAIGAAVATAAREAGLEF